MNEHTSYRNRTIGIELVHYREEKSLHPSGVFRHLARSFKVSLAYRAEKLVPKMNKCCAGGIYQQTIQAHRGEIFGVGFAMYYSGKQASDSIAVIA